MPVAEGNERIIITLTQEELRRVDDARIKTERYPVTRSVMIQNALNYYFNREDEKNALVARLERLKNRVEALDASQQVTSEALMLFVKLLSRILPRWEEDEPRAQLNAKQKDRFDNYMKGLTKSLQEGSVLLRQVHEGYWDDRPTEESVEHAH
jgi:predicted NACHT family NTPase